MGRKRQRAGVSVRRLSLALAAALAWAAAADALDVASRIRLRALGEQLQVSAGTVHAEAGVLSASAENREGSSSGEPTPAPSSAAPTPSSAEPTPTPTSHPPSSSSSRGDETAPSSAPPATTPAPTPAPAPSSSAENASSPPPATPSVEPTTQPPAPSTEPPAPSTSAPAPTSAQPETTPAPTPTPTPTPAPTPAPIPAPTPAPTPAPPGPTPAPTPAPAPAPTPATPAPTPAPSPPTSSPPASTTPAPAPSTTAPTATTVAPTSTTPTVTPTPTPSPTPTTKTPTTLTKSPTATGTSSGSGAHDKTASDSNGKVSAPDLSTLTPIAGSGIISKSTRHPSSSGSDGASSTSKNKAADGGLNRISTLGVAGIVIGLLGVVVVAILFVHVRRKRSEKLQDSTRQRQLDEFFSHDAAPPIHSRHPGAASFVSSNGMSFMPPRNSLTPPSEIPIASSGRFKRPGKPMTPGNPNNRGTGRFSDSVMSEGGIFPKGRMYSIPASPHGQSSDFDQTNDSFLGGKDDSSVQTSSRSGFSIRTSSDHTGPRDTSFSRGSSEPRSTYFPMGMSESRLTMVQMGMAGSELPRGESGDILIPRSTHDGASTEYSLSSDDYGSPENRIERGHSNVSSVSNPNPWALVTLDDALIKSISPPTSFDAASREVSEASVLSDLPSSRSGGSFYMSDDGGRSTRGKVEDNTTTSQNGSGDLNDRRVSFAFSADSYTDDGNRSNRSDSYGYESDQRSNRSDSYGYVDSSFTSGSARSALSFMSSDSDRRSSTFRPSQSGGTDIEEGHI